jgi:hypothetical protein
MDFFTLGFLPKIDFNYEHNNSTTATAKELADLHNFSLKYTIKALKNSISNSVNNICLEASIYRPQKT